MHDNLVTVERIGTGEYLVTFALTDGPHRRLASDKAQVGRIIERVLPGYLPRGKVTMREGSPFVRRALSGTLPAKDLT